MHRVCISSVAGESLDLELPATDTIVNVKHAVASTWCIPCSCQKLLNDAEVLEDSAPIEKCLPSSTIGAALGLFLTVVVSLDVVRANINSKDACSDVRAAKRVYALQELGVLGLRGGHAGIALVVNCLEEKDERVCRAAIEALSKFAVRGNKEIIAALLPKLKHKRCNVKRIVLEFIGQLAEVGNQGVVNEICSCLEQHVTSAEVTAAAIDTLSTLALQGDQEYIVACLTSTLAHKSKLVRRVAVQALAKLAERGIAISIVPVSGCLADTHPEVRIAALKAVAKIAGKGDQDALKAVGCCIADAESSVRLAALCAMAEIAGKGDENAFAYTRLFGAYKRRSDGASVPGTSASSEEGRIIQSHPFAAALDAQSQSSNTSSCAPSSQVTSHGLGDGSGDCIGACNRRAASSSDDANRQKSLCNMQ